MNELRGHLARPLNREHFHQLCRSLADEHWNTPFMFDAKAIERTEKVRFWARLPSLDSVIAINCHWHGRGTAALMPDQIDRAISMADCFQPPVGLFFILTSSNASEQLCEHIERLNRQRKLGGQFTIQIWCWDAIEELLISCKQTAKKYLTLGFAMNPRWFAGSLDNASDKVSWLKRIHNGKKDRNKTAPDTTSHAAFNHFVTDAFERHVHSTQYRAHSRYLRVANAPAMGHAVALIHDNRQIELWLLTPEPRDAEYREDIKMWVRHLMQRAVKQVFAHILLKNYHHQNLIRLRVHLVLHKSPLVGCTGTFIGLTNVEPLWGDLYPGESLKNSRHLVAEAVIEDDQVKVTQCAFLYGCTLTHVYQFPVASVSPNIVRNALVGRFYPKVVPHSHKILVDDEQIYWRPLGDFDEHIRRQAPQSQPPSSVIRLTCRNCASTFWGFRPESRCAVCDLKQGMFGRTAGVSLTHNDLFQTEILRPSWDL